MEVIVENYDACTETYLRLDSSGHGDGSVPDYIGTVLNGFETLDECLKPFQETYLSFLNMKKNPRIHINNHTGDAFTLYLYSIVGIEVFP